MLIDWFTVVAQALNFFILMWLMRRYLYRPILNAIDAREDLIAKELANAKAIMVEAQKERDEFRDKNEKFDEERRGLMEKAVAETQIERRNLLEEARSAAEAFRAARDEALRAEQRNLNEEITRWTRNQVFAISRKVLADLASLSLEAQMSEAFVNRIRGLSGEAKERLASALTKPAEPVTVRSVFEMPEEQRTEIRNSINEAFSAEIHLDFETVPELISGVELYAHGQKVSWSIDGYLATLEKSASELLITEKVPEPRT